MERRQKIQAVVSFLLLLGGLLILAFSTEINVFQDPRRVEQTGSVDEDEANLAALFFASLLAAWGVAMGFGAVSRAGGGRRHGALGAVFGGVFLLMFLHGKLFINSVTIAPERGGATVAFTASYFFHTGPGYTFPAVYVIFLVTVLLLTLAVAGAAYLITPDRFRRAFGGRASWRESESLAVTVSLFVVLSFVVFLVSFIRLAVDADVQGDRSGFLADNVVALHYMTAFLLGALVLTIGARVFLVNWGTQGVFQRGRVEETLGNVGRIERVLLGAVVLFDLILLAAPPIVGPFYLSTDAVFGLTSKMLQVSLLMVLIPYAFYAWTIKRLTRQLADGGGPEDATTPFSNLSVRLVLVHMGGILLLTAVYAALSARGGTDALVLLLGYAAYTAAVFLWAAIRFELRGGIPTPRLRGPGAAAPFFGFVVFGLVTAMILWGAGNTFEALYFSETNTMTVRNYSPWGADVLARIGAALLGAATLAIALGALADATRIRRPLVGHYVAVLVASVAALLVAFTVNVWSGRGGVGQLDVFAGFSFHQYGTLETTLAIAVLTVSLGVLYYSVGRILRWATRRRPVLRATESLE